MPDGLKIRIDMPYGLRQIHRHLKGISEAARDMGPVWKVIGDDARRIVSERFESEGPGWAQLSPAYAARKEREYPGTTILYRTGELWASLVDNPAVIQVDPTRMSFGETAMPYGRFHQTGTYRMPARKPVEFTESQRRKWVRAAQRHLKGGEVRAL